MRSGLIFREIRQTHRREVEVSPLPGWSQQTERERIWLSSSEIQFTGCVAKYLRSETFWSEASLKQLLLSLSGALASAQYLRPWEACDCLQKVFLVCLSYSL